MHSTTDAARERRSRRRAFAEPVHDHEIVLLHALSDAARQMHRSLSLDEVVGVATDRAREIVDATWAVTSQTTNEDWANAITTTSVRTPTTPAAPGLALVPPAGLSVAVDVCRGNRPLRLSRVEIPAADATRADGGGDARPTVVGWMAAPLVGSDGRNLGLIQLAREDREFTASDEAVLVQLAGMASVAIENARLYEAAVHARTQLAWAAHIERVRAAELRAVIEAMGEAVLVFDANGRVSLVNPAPDALFAGRPVMTYDDLLSRLHTDVGGRVPVDAAGPTEVRVVDERDR